MIYNIVYGFCGEFENSTVIEGPQIKNVEEILEEYQKEWRKYIHDLRKKYNNEEIVEQKALEKIKKSFPINKYNKYFGFEDYEDDCTFGLNMLIQNHYFHKIQKKTIYIDL